MTLSDRFDHTQAVSVVLHGQTVPDDVRARARRFVALQATDLADRVLLLDALGIGFTPEEVAEYRAAIEQDTLENTVTCPVEATER